MKLRSAFIAGALVACSSDLVQTPVDASLDAAPTHDAAADAPDTSMASAFFYQDVSPSGNKVRVGVTQDGKLVDSYDKDVLSWKSLGGEKQTYGDPVFSRLPDGRWAMTAWSNPADPRGGGALMYHESTCPKVVDSDVLVIKPLLGSACRTSSTLVGGKTSQVFEVNGSRYVFVMNGGEIYLVRLTDSTHTALDLKSVCIRLARPTKFADIGWGDAALVIDKTLASGLLLSDTGIARRKDGTWTLVAKGVPSSLGCAGGSLCELCGRSLYRTTSTDLINWSSLVKIVDQASVPEATNYADGSVWYYWQNFAPTCAAQDLKLAARAPIAGAFELADGSLSAPVTVSIPKEPFETDTNLHYATNANPILLPTSGAKNGFDACFGR